MSDYLSRIEIEHHDFNEAYRQLSTRQFFEQKDHSSSDVLCGMSQEKRLASDLKLYRTFYQRLALEDATKIRQKDAAVFSIESEVIATLTFS